jgi:Contact-dependent growth inhibition CdiA C-terminal domain
MGHAAWGTPPPWLRRGTEDPPGEPPVQRSLPPCPEGDGQAIAVAGRLWQELHADIRDALAGIDGSPLRWSGTARTAFDAAWSRLSAGIRETAARARETGDHLLRASLDIEDGRYQWDLGRRAIPRSTGVDTVDGDRTAVTFASADAAEVTQAARIMDEASQALAGRLDNLMSALREATVSRELRQELVWDLPDLDAVPVQPVWSGARGEVAFRVPGQTVMGQGVVGVPGQPAAGQGGFGAPGHPAMGEGPPPGSVSDPEHLHEVLTGAGGASAAGAAAHATASAARGGGLDAGVSAGDLPVLLAGALAAVALVAQTRRRGDTEAPHEGTEPSGIDELARTFSEFEHAVAELLHAEGSEVASVAESAERTPSALVDGRRTAFKFLGDGANGQTVRNALNSAKGQASSIVVGARGSGLTEGEALTGLRRFLDAHPPGVSRVRIIGDGFDLTHPRGGAA